MAIHPKGDVVWSRPVDPAKATLEQVASTVMCDHLQVATKSVTTAAARAAWSPCCCQEAEVPERAPGTKLKTVMEQ